MGSKQEAFTEALNLACPEALPTLLAAANRALNFMLNHQNSLGIPPNSDDELETTKILRRAIAIASDDSNIR